MYCIHMLLCSVIYSVFVSIATLIQVYSLPHYVESKLGIIMIKLICFILLSSSTKLVVPFQESCSRPCILILRSNTAEKKTTFSR
jgi:hypothetical protein